MLKVELHAHSGDDPVDRLPYSTTDLIDRAASTGYDALAITLHDHRFDIAPLTGYARARGVTLIPGIERTIEGRHVLLLNFGAAVDRVTTFADLARLKADGEGVVIAPHAFYPTSTCLGAQLMARYAHLFDAIEYNAMFTASVNFNRPAETFARLYGKPMVGNGDIHRLSQLNTTFSLVDAAPEASAICAAVRAGRVTVQATPLSAFAAVATLTDLVGMSLRRKLFWPDVPASAPLRA